MTHRGKVWVNSLKAIFRCQEPGDPTGVRAACGPGNWLGAELPPRSPGESCVYSSCSSASHVCFCASEPSVIFLPALFISSSNLSNPAWYKLQGINPVWRGHLHSDATALLCPTHRIIPWTRTDRHDSSHWLPGRQPVGGEEREQEAISRRHKGCVECVSFRNIDPVWLRLCPSQTVWPGTSGLVFPTVCFHLSNEDAVDCGRSQGSNFM